jgi:hypothetical protein
VPHIESWEGFKIHCVLKKKVADDLPRRRAGICEKTLGSTKRGGEGDFMQTSKITLQLKTSSAK